MICSRIDWPLSNLLSDPQRKSYTQSTNWLMQSIHVMCCGLHMWLTDMVACSHVCFRLWVHLQLGDPHKQTSQWEDGQRSHDLQKRLPAGTTDSTERAPAGAYAKWVHRHQKHLKQRQNSLKLCLFSWNILVPSSPPV